jgi:hypothetical protein
MESASSNSSRARWSGAGFTNMITADAVGGLRDQPTDDGRQPLARRNFHETGFPGVAENPVVARNERR